MIARQSSETVPLFEGVSGTRIETVKQPLGGISARLEESFIFIFEPGEKPFPQMTAKRAERKKLAMVKSSRIPEDGPRHDEY
ncbi:hypothetical protein V2J97_21940 [Pseudomonas alliivorans]|nr:hypothetical protein [Pseudomonas alliivorans]